MTPAQIADLVGRLKVVAACDWPQPPAVGEAIREAIAALDALTRERRSWSPIETAPKDGTPVALAEFSEYFDQWQFGVSYWRKYLIEGEGFAWIGHAPTHWMPLPTPPTEGGHS